MKKVLIMCSLFLFASGSMSYAAGKESGSVSFPSAVRIGTSSLPAGTYAIHAAARFERRPGDAIRQGP